MHDERSNSHKANIIRQLKANGLKVLGLKLASGLTEAKAFELEIEWIARIGREPLGPLVNKTTGGEGVSMPQSPEQRARLIALHTGRKRSDATKAAIGAAQKGRKRSPEEIERHAASLRGRALSDEQKAAISASMKGRKCPEGTRLALIESNKRRAGFKWTPEYREKMMAARAAKKLQRLAEP